VQVPSFSSSTCPPHLLRTGLPRKAEFVSFPPWQAPLFPEHLTLLKRTRIPPFLFSRGQRRDSFPPLHLFAFAPPLFPRDPPPPLPAGLFPLSIPLFSPSKCGTWLGNPSKPCDFFPPLVVSFSSLPDDRLKKKSLIQMSFPFFLRPSSHDGPLRGHFPPVRRLSRSLVFLWRRGPFLYLEIPTFPSYRFFVARGTPFMEYKTPPTPG